MDFNLKDKNVLKTEKSLLSFTNKEMFFKILNGKNDDEIIPEDYDVTLKEINSFIHKLNKTSYNVMKEFRNMENHPFLERELALGKWVFFLTVICSVALYSVMSMTNEKAR